MKPMAFRIGSPILLGAGVLLLCGAPAPAGDFDGKWIMNANGWKFILQLEQKGNTITGTMTGINNEQKSTVEGKINGNEITFTRDDGQEYRGFLLADDPTGKTNKLTMAGIFKGGD